MACWGRWGGKKTDWAVRNGFFSGWDPEGHDCPSKKGESGFFRNQEARQGDDEERGAKNSLDKRGRKTIMQQR